MMVKVFEVNKNGKIELTKDELEKILNDAWHNGWYDGHNSRSWSWTSPNWYSTITNTNPTPYTISTTTADTK